MPRRAVGFQPLVDCVTAGSRGPEMALVYVLKQLRMKVELGLSQDSRKNVAPKTKSGEMGKTSFAPCLYTLAPGESW